MDEGGPTEEWEGQPPELEPIGTLDPNGDEVVNLITEDEDDEIITIQSDVDQVAEESGSTPLCLSEDDSPENDSPDTRSGKDRSETELLEQGRAEVRPEEGTNEAVQSSLEEVDPLGTTLGESIHTLPDNKQTPADGVLTREVGPLGTTHERGSLTEARPTSDGGDVEPEPEVNDPNYSPALECIRGLANCVQRLDLEQQKETINVMRYLLALENPRLKPEDYERVPLGKDDDFAGRLRPTGRVQPVRNETEGRPSSKNGGKECPAVSKMAAPKMADRDRDEAPPYRNPNGSQRLQRPKDRRAQQEWSSEPHCRHGSAVESRDDSPDQNSDSLFSTDTQVPREEHRTGQERATGARPKTGQYGRGHAQSGQQTAQARRRVHVPTRRERRSELRDTSDVLSTRQEEAEYEAAFRHGSSTGSNMIPPSGPTGAKGRSKRQRGGGRRRRRFRGKDDRPPPGPPTEWSPEVEAGFHRLLRKWAEEQDPRIRDEGIETSGTEDEQTDEESVRRIKEPTHNNVHLTGLMQNPENGKSTRLRMVIDQGQTVKQGIMISEELMQKLNLSYAKLLPGKKVGTAKGGASIEKVGITKPFTIKIPGISRTFLTKAIVCKDVADQCNLGTAFLQSIHRATGLKPRLEFSKDGTRLVLGEDQVELVRRVAPLKPSTEVAAKEGGKELGPEAPNPVDRSRQTGRRTVQDGQKRSVSRRRAALPVFAEKDTIMKGNSLNFVQVGRIPASALLEPVETPGLGGARAVPGVYRDQKRVAVLNLEGDRVLRAGTQIAEIIPTKHILQKLPEEKVRSAKESEDRSEELIKELGLDEKKLLNADPDLKEKVKALVREYTDIFSSPEVSFGKTSLIEFEVTLEPGSKPVKAKVRPTNPKQRQDLREQLDRWEAEDVVEECESPWASGLVPVLKKDGGIRWAVDYRPLNKMTIKDSYPLPSISENLEKLQGSQVYSTLDAAGAYHCIPVHAKTRPLLAFVTPFGLYTWKRMPFGAANSGPCYSRFMEMLVSKLRSPWTLCYLDDLMVHTVTTEHHLDELRKVFQMHREAGIRLRAKKTFLFETEAYYLGYKITQKGVCMREDYVEKILEWPTPKTVKELSSFLGVVGYYRSFISKFASLTHEMNAQKKKKELEWNDSLQAKFEHLKKLFGEKPIRAYPDYEGKCFEVWPDFSALAFGGVLQQEQDGQRRFIAASGRKTTAGERNYPPTKGELASIVHILRKHEHLLRYKKFKVFTDHQPLKWLRTMKNPKGIYWRWLNELESYDFEVVHVAGKSTGAADGLSRSSHLPDPTAEEIEEAEEYVFRTFDQGVHHSKLDRAALKEAQEQDEVLRIVKQWVKGDPPKSKEEIRGLPQDAHVYHQHLAVLDVDEGDLLVMTKSPGFNQEVQRILVPNNAKLRDEIFQFSHMHPSAGHFGTQATSARAALKFYWPGMASELKQQVKKCDTCLAKIQQVNLKSGQHKPRKHGFPGEVLYIDLVGPMPTTHDGMKYIVTMQDGFSRYCTACTIPNKEAVTVANALLDAWITKFGCPVRIHSDQGREFHNSIWHQLCDRLQIQKTMTPAYNPQSNLVERFHRTLNSIMRTHLAREDAGWSRFLPMATFAFNTKVNATTGVTPFEVWMGRAAKLPIDLVVPTPDRQWPDADAYIQETLIRFEEMFRFMRKHTEATFKRNARLYAGNANTFQVNDLVWIYSKRKVPNKPTKITDGWTGPYRVVGKPAEVLLDVTPADSEGRTTTVHVARATPVRGEGQKGRNPLPQQEAVEDGDADELAEDLCLPARWIEPADNLLVPVKTAPEPPLIRDLPMRSIPVKAAPAQRGQTDGAGPSTAQSTDDALEGHSKKRARAPTVSDEDPDTRKQGKFKGEKRGPEKPRQAEPPKHRRRQADKREHQSDSDSPTSTDKPKSKLGWRDLVRDSGSESGVSDKEMQMPHKRLQEEEEDASLSSSDEDVKALREVFYDLGDYVTIDIPPGIKPPVRATAVSGKGAAGWDCRANQAVTIGPRQTRKVDIGLKMALPAGLCALLLSRSRLASEGVTVEGGLIDSEYRGPISCILHNNTECSRRIQKGEKICQLVIIATPPITWRTVQRLDDPVRDDGGLGHTGQL